MAMNPEQLQRIFEAALMVAGRPLAVADLQKLFDEADQPDVKLVRETIATIQASYADRGVELQEIASGFQFQAKADYSPWLSRLWDERAPRFTRAFLETIALIAYRQPITRAEIEEIRGVAVSSNIIKTLQEREWIRVLGYRDVPGKPALYGTTKIFLDHLNLKSLDELPSLSELLDVDSQAEKLQVELELRQTSSAESSAANDTEINVADLHPASEETETPAEHAAVEEQVNTDIAHDENVEALADVEDTDTDDSHDENAEATHASEAEHADACFQDEDEHLTTQTISEADADEITSDPYPEETEKA